jgi:hypothetical protein
MMNYNYVRRTEFGDIMGKTTPSYRLNLRLFSIYSASAQGVSSPYKKIHFMHCESKTAQLQLT